MISRGDQEGDCCLARVMSAASGRGDRQSGSTEVFLAHERAMEADLDEEDLLTREQLELKAEVSLKEGGSLLSRARGFPNPLTGEHPLPTA